MAIWKCQEVLYIIPYNGLRTSITKKDCLDRGWKRPITTNTNTRGMREQMLRAAACSMHWMAREISFGTLHETKSEEIFKDKDFQRE